MEIKLICADCGYPIEDHPCPVEIIQAVEEGWRDAKRVHPEHEKEYDIYVDGFRITDCLYSNYEDSRPTFFDEKKDIIIEYTSVQAWRSIPDPPIFT